MKRIAIYYGTTEGQTSKIAEAIAQELSNLNCATHLVQASDQPWHFQSENYDGVILGASVHLSRYPSEFCRRVQDCAVELRKIPSAFFSVCLGVLEKNNPKTQEAEREIVRSFLDHVRIKPSIRAIFAGALKYSKYGFVKRMALHAIVKKGGMETQTDRDYEFTDWEEVKEFARAFVDTLNKAPSPFQKFPADFAKGNEQEPHSSLESECCP